MSQDPALVPYHLALECLQETEGLFHNPNHINISFIKTGLQNCLQKINDIILSEDNDGPFLPHLLQLDQHYLELLKLFERKSILPNESTNNSSNILTQNSNETEKEKQQLIDMVESTAEISLTKGLENVAGLFEVKKILKSLVILPKTQPQIFKDIKIFNSLLLYGPPGTGKTRIVHALAYEAKANLYCITCGSIMSSFVGQTERNIKFIFEYIKRKATYTILFIDEVDGFCRKRSNVENDQTRRIKTEFLCQLNQLDNQPNIFLICATNCPWDLDTAFLRRFQKHIYIPLPNKIERIDLFKYFLKGTSFEITDQWQDLILKTEGWSGSDISNLVQEALKIPIFELQVNSLWKECADGFFEPHTLGDGDYSNIVCDEIGNLPPNSVRARKAKLSDLLDALDSVTKTVKSFELQKYEEFCK